MNRTLKERVAVAVGTLTLSAAGVTGIVQHEGMVHTAYVDPVGVVTICAGHIRTARVGQVRTLEQCEALLRSDTREAEYAVKRLVTVPVTQAQYDALVSFTFNLGQGALSRSTLLRKANAGDCAGAGREFDRWNKGFVKGKPVVLRGLVTRRADERRSWDSGCKA
jgi:lysozyme